MRAFQEWCELWAAECLRVLRPGGHLLAFGGTRTHHRLTVGIEDAGFEIRDTIAWLYSSGFAKGRDFPRLDHAANGDHEAATKWAGWNVALKPAHEPIVVARKPLAGTIAANVQAWGTGAINIDACRVGSGGQLKWAQPRDMGYHGGTDAGPVAATENPAGRWPANVALDGTTADALDAQSGTLTSSLRKPHHDIGRTQGACYGAPSGAQYASTYGDSGGASRFFPTFRDPDDSWPAWKYTPKAPTRERPTYYAEGADTREDATSIYTGKPGRECNVCGSRGKPAGGEQSGKPWPTCGHGDWSMVEALPKPPQVSHPTVKPVDLFAWLIRLVVPPDGVFIDPFAGSGPAGEAATLERVNAILIEKDPTSLPLITARLHTHRPRRQAPPPAPGQAHQPDLFDHLNGGPA